MVSDFDGATEVIARFLFLTKSSHSGSDWDWKAVYEDFLPLAVDLERYLGAAGYFLLTKDNLEWVRKDAVSALDPG